MISEEPAAGNGPQQQRRRFQERSPAQAVDTRFANALTPALTFLRSTRGVRSDRASPQDIDRSRLSVREPKGVQGDASVGAEDALVGVIEHGLSPSHLTHYQ